MHFKGGMGIICSNLSRYELKVVKVEDTLEYGFSPPDCLKLSRKGKFYQTLTNPPGKYYFCLELTILPFRYDLILDPISRVW